MKMNLKKSVLLGLSCIAFQSMNAQANAALWDNLSIEGQYGLNSALAPNEGIETADYSGFNFFQVGLLYHIDDLWGVRGTFANSNFKHKDLDEVGVKYSKLVLEATYNILKGINKQESAFDIVAHAGFGLGFGKSEHLPDDDMVGVAQIGLMPKYSFSNRISLFIDGTFVNQFSQNYRYNGFLTEDKESGNYINLGLGVSVRLGK